MRHKVTKIKEGKGRDHRIPRNEGGLGGKVEYSKNTPSDKGCSAMGLPLCISL